MLSWGDTWRFATGVLSGLPERVAVGQISGPGNQSVGGIWYWLAPGHPWLMAATSCAVFAAALALAARLLRRGPDDAVLASAVIVGVAVPMLTPVSWPHHAVFLLPAIVLLLARPRPAARVAAVVVWLLLVSRGPYWAAMWLDSGAGALTPVAGLLRETLLCADVVAILALTFATPRTPGADRPPPRPAAGRPDRRSAGQERGAARRVGWRRTARGREDGLMTEPVERPVSGDDDPRDEPHRIVIVGPDGQPVGELVAEDDQSEERSITDLVEQPAKVMRIGSMIKQLLDEVRSAPLDEASRQRLKEIHARSIAELEDGLAPELVAELDRLSLPFGEDATPSDAELRIAQAQLVGWLEGLFHGIQTALFAQQMAARAQFEEMRRRAMIGPGPGGEEPDDGATPPGLALRPDGRPARGGTTGPYL